MKRTGLKRATSGVLSFAMIASALFSDFTVPTNVFASDDTTANESSLDVYSESDGSITSEYIVENLDEDLGEEAALLNEAAAMTVAEEYLVSELTVSSNDADEVTSEDTGTEATETVTGTDDVLMESISVSSNDADTVSTSSNDAGIVTLSLDDETDNSAEETGTEETVTVSEEDITALAEEILDSADDITTAEDYDTNGLAPTYHYIVLNYSLVNEDYVWDGMTIDDLWNEVPDAFIASYLTTINVYTLEDNEDYYVAFIDPAALNGLGSAIYADFTDLNTDSPTVYNDIITFDAETGLVYIPKSFYFNENGEETLKELEAQVLVPYSFDNEESSVSVSVSSEIDGVEGISGTSSVPTLDVTMTIQIVDAEDADKITLDDISLTVNDDMLPFDTTGDNAYYDAETGELTISASPNNVYAVNVTISENISEETLASISQKEILVASTGDLSNILVADSGYTGEAYKADNATDMNTVDGIDIEVLSGSLVAGQTFTYNAAWDINTGSSAGIVNEVIANTATYSYYAQTSTGGAVEVDSANWSQFFDSNGNIALSSSTEAQYLLRAISSTAMSSTYNRIFELPVGKKITSTAVNSTTASITMTGSIANSSNYSVDNYGKYIAIHCVHNAQEAYYAGAESGDSDPVTLRVLYVGNGYVIVSATIPIAYAQAGSGVYKFTTSTITKEYYTQFGINKVDSETGKSLGGAVFGYAIRSSFTASVAKTNAQTAASIADEYSSGSITATRVEDYCKAIMDGTYTSTANSISYLLADSNNNSVVNHLGSQGYLYVYITEVIAPDGYERNTGVWVLKVSVSDKDYDDTKILSAEYYDYDVDSGTLSSTSSSVEYTSGNAYFTAPNDETDYDYYGAMDLRKVDEEGNYVGGAVYALLDYGSKNDFTSYAATANATGSASAAIKSFYTSLSNAGYESRLEGVYTTSSSGAVHLKSVTSSGTVSSSNKVLDFDTQQQAYVLVEIYSPSSYKLDTSYYTFVLDANYNTSNSYTTAANNTTFEGWLHKGNQIEEIVNEDSLTAKLIMEVADDYSYYYAKIGIKKVKKNDTSTLVSGAVYGLFTDIDDAKKVAAKTYGSASAALSAGNNGEYVTTTTSTQYWDVQSWLQTEGTQMTYYIVEAYAPSGYVRDTNVYQITVTGTTASTGVGCSIESPTVAYPTSGATNYMTRTNSTTVGSYVIHKENDTYYARIGVQKVKSSTDSEKISGAVYAISTSLTTLNNLVSTVSSYTSASDVMDEANDTSGVSAVTTSASATSYFSVQSWDAKNGDSQTYYMVELFAPTNYTRETGYYTIKVTGTTDSDGKAADITSTTSSTSSYVKVVDSASGDYNVVDEEDAIYYGKVGVLKVDEDNNSQIISGAVYGLFTSLDDAKTVAQASYSTANAARTGISGNSGSYKTSSSSVAYWTKSWAPSAGNTQTYYITEAYAPSGYVRDRNVYEVTVTGSQAGYASSTISSATVAYSYSDNTNRMSRVVDANGSYFTHKEPESYYGAMDLVKLDPNGNKVGGAVYILIETGAGVSYTRYTTMAKEAYEANKTDSEAAMKAFYKAMSETYNKAGTATLDTYIVGGYVTFATGAAGLKSLNSDGTVSSSTTVLDFGTSTQKKYVLVEIWAPSGYTLDDSYYAFYLKPNSNTSSTYSTAVNKTTMITSTSDSSTAPLHQNDGDDTANSSNTWSEYATITNGGSTTAALNMAVIEDEEDDIYYGALNLMKVNADDTDDYVAGAIYMLVDYDSGMSTTYLNSLITAAATANAAGKSGGTSAAILSFYNSLGSYQSCAEGVYITTGSSTTSSKLRSFDTSTGERTGNKVINFGTSSDPKTFLLIEIFSPAAYDLNSHLYCFTLKANSNTSTTYDTAVNKTTYNSDRSSISSAFTSLSTDVTISGGSSTAETLIFTMEDTPVSKPYYGKVGVEKVDEDDSSQLISGAVYGLFTDLDDAKDVANASYSNATNASSGINSHSGDSLTTSSSGVKYWSMSWEESLGDEMTYYITEAYAPDGYIRDRNVYVVKVTGSQDSAAKSTISDPTVVYSYNSNTTDRMTRVVNTSSGSYVVHKEYEHYYGAMDLTKLDSDGNKVGGAVYILIETGAGVSYTRYTTMAKEAYEANKTDSEAAMKAFYKAMSETYNKAGTATLDTYIVGGYVTFATGAAGLKSLNSDGTVSSSTTVLDFGTSTKKKYVLVEIWTPTGYTLDDSYYAFYLQPNDNVSSTYSTAVNKTTMITSTSDSSTAPLHQKDGDDTANSSNTWSEYATITNGGNTTAALNMAVEDKTATYYGAMNFNKKLLGSSTTYVKGAVYVLIETGAGISYSRYTTMAAEAYENNKFDSAAAMKEFYTSMKNYSSGDLTGYIMGAYTTTGTSTAAELKKVTSSGTISSTNAVLNFGSEEQKKYVLVEVWTPSGFTLDDSYYAFYLESNKNESNDYDTAVNETTMITSTANASTAPLHQKDGNSTANSTNTWSSYATVTNGSTLNAALSLTGVDEPATYYGAMNLTKLDPDGKKVGGAVYILIETGAGIGYYNYVDMATEAYEDNKLDSTAAMKDFYSSMKSYTTEDGTAIDLTQYIVGGYVTFSTGEAGLKKVNSDGTVSSSTTVLDFGTSSQKKYVLVEIWTPTGYTLDDSYYAFYLQPNKNESATYSTAVANTTMITSTSSSTTAPLHQKKGSTSNSTNTWSTYASVENADNLTLALALSVTDEPATYYAAIDMKKLDTDGEPVGNAMYALVDITDMTSTEYASLLSLAQSAYASTIVSSDVSKEHAMYLFYQNMSSKGLSPSTNIAGFYRTHTDGSLSALKSYNVNTSSAQITINDTSAGSVTLNFGSDQTRKYALVEVWTPLGYTLEDDYFAFTLDSNKNESSNRSAALRASTLTTIHTNSAIAVSGNSSAASTAGSGYILSLTATNEPATYYGALDLIKKSRVENKYVEGAVYVLIETGADIGYYNYVDLATAAYEANKDDSEAAMKAFYKAMSETYNKAKTATLDTYIVGGYITKASGASGLKALNSDGTISSSTTVLDFGTSTKKKYVLVEVWTPSDYELDTSYYAFYLESNRNESATYSTAVKMTTVITDETDDTYAPIHQTKGSTTNSTNTWGMYTLLTGADSLTQNAVLTVRDDELTSHTVTKEFNSTTTESLVTSVTMELYADGKSTGKSVTLDKTNYNWTYTWEGLEKYDKSDDHEIEYTVKETAVTMKDQIHTATVNTVTTALNTVFTVDIDELDGETQIGNTVVTRPVNVQKTFGDDDTKDRVQWVIVELLRDGVETGKTLTLSASNNWYDTFENLVKYDPDGNEYKYTVQEKYVNYNDMWGSNHTVSGSVMTTLFTTTQSTSGETVTIKNTFNFAEYTVSKTLDTALTESLVTSVTAELYADDVKFDSVVLSDSNSWTNSTWKGTLDKYNYQGKLITYSSDEVQVTMKDQMHTSVVNTVPKSAVKTVFDVNIQALDGETVIGDTVVTTELKVEKKFGNNDTEDRTNMVVVMLYRNDEITGRTLVLNEGNGWTNTFTDLVKYDPNGVEYEYRAEEYVIRYRDMWGDYHNISNSTIMNTLFVIKTVTEDGVTTITNTFNTVDYSVSKTLGSYLTEQLVESVTMELYADGRTYDSVVLSDTNSWKNSTWRGTLDEYDYTGKLITYTSKEVEIQMEDQFDATVVYSVTSAIETVFDVIIDTDDYANQIDNTVVTIDVDVEKVFADDKTKDRISEVVVTLYRNDEAKPYTITLNESNNWKGTFEKLVKYDPDGVEYEYRAVETSVTYTDMWGDTYTVESRKAIENLFAVEEVTANYKTTVTNDFQFTERNVMKLFATKITSDRLVQITARLYADGRDASSLFGDRILNADTNWLEIWDGYNSKNVWIGLDKYDHNGVEITYTTKEIQAIYTDKDSPVETQHIVSGGTLITIFEPVYDDDVDETTSSITNELQTVDLKVVKTWGDYTESHLVSIDVELWENNNPTGKIVTLSAENDWTYTWKDLDKYDSIARAYKYEAKEVSVTYTDMWGDEYTVTPDDLMFVLFDVETETEDGVTTIKNTYATTEYTVNKTFGTTLTESLVESIEAMLVADGRDAEIAFANLILTADGSWTGTWYGIDKYDHEGNEVVYTAKEVSVDMADQFDATVISTVKDALNTVFTVITTIGDGETTVDNTVVTTEHTVVKKFGENTDGRITEVEVTLYRNGKEMPATLTLNEANGWTDTFTDLVKYDPEGNEYEYSAVETKVTYNDMWGESHTITDENIINTVFDVDAETADDTTTITNTIRVTEHNVVKTFGSDLTESLVESIVAELFANSVSLETVFGNKTLTEATGWSATWEKLDKYDYNGILYSYTSEEVSVDMADQFDATVISTVKDALNTVFTVITSTDNGTTTVDNTVNTTYLDVEKVFGDKTEQRIKEVEVTLYRNGEAKPYTLTLNAENNWSDTFENLVKYDPDGNEYEYTAVETGVTYYDMWGDEYTVNDADVLDKLFNVEAETSDNKTTITNTFQYTTRAVIKNFATTLTLSRMVEITTTLYADDVSTKVLFGDKTLNADNAWVNDWDGYDETGNTWIGLDKYDHEGNLITYTVRETTATYKDKNLNSGTTHTVVNDVLVTLFAPEYDDEVDETTSGITNNFQTTDFTVEKTFGEGTEGRIVNIVAELYENNKATGQTVTLDDTNDWTYTWEQLDKFDSTGVTYDYTAKEISVSYIDMWGDTYTIDDEETLSKIFDVDMDYTPTKTTITNTLRMTKYTVSKTFGTDLTEGIVESIVAELFADGNSLENLFGNATLNVNNSWSFTWTGLDKFDHEGNRIVYTAQEVSADVEDQFDATVVSTVKDTLETLFTVITTTTRGGTTVDNTIVTTELEVEKTFGDDTESRISEVEVTLYRNGEAMPATLTLSDDNSWTDTFTDLVMYDPEGVAYEYEAVETSVTYTDMWGETYTVTDADVLDKLFNVNAVTEDGKTTITNTFEYTERAVTKSFASDLAEKRIQSITTTLYAGSTSLEAVFGDITLNADNSWTDTWTGLDKYDYEGNKIVYTARETTATYLDMDDTLYTVSDDALVIIFTPEVNDEVDETSSEITNDFAVTEHTVIKTFGDVLSEERVINVVAELYRNGEETGRTVVLSEDNDWTYTWTELDMYDSTGTAYEYTAVEVSVTYMDVRGDEQTITGEMLEKIFNSEEETLEKVTLLTNTLETATHEVVKVFMEDTTAKDDVEFVTVQLYADGVAIGSEVTLNDANEWTCTWADLDMYNADGSDVVYTVKEILINGEITPTPDNGYIVTYDDSVTTITTITNDTTKLEISKTDIVTSEEVEGAKLTIYSVDENGERTEYDSWTSTDEPHYIEKIPTGNYVLVEEYAPGSYVTAHEVEFTVEDTAEIQKVNMEDDFTKVEISKTDIVNGEEVEGATLTIYSVDENGERTAVETWTSTTEPHYIERLDKGNYVLVEEYAPGSYVTAHEVEFTVEDTAEIQKVNMEDDFTKVEISKTDIVNGEEVEGATLTIYSVDENGERTAVETWTSTTEPHYIERLDKGNYVLVEEYAPTCYVTANEVEFTVEDTAEIQKVEMVDDITKVEISKTDMVDCEEVMGATLTVYRVNDDGTRTLIDTWVTDGTPYTIERLDKGTYVLVEENTPDGYQVAEEVTFEVIDTGEIQKVDMKDARTYGKVVVNKVDENGDPLEGVEFTITNKETGEVVDVLITDENGYAESKELPIDERLADQTLALIVYTIQETATVSDYALDDTVTEFTFTYVDDTTPVVTYTLGATNELQKGRIAVMKKGLAAVGTDKVETVYGTVEKLVYDYIYLPGVEFTIYADEDLTEVVATITTDKDGAAYSDYLPVGTYYVVETFTPAGYVADDTVYTVTITGDDTGSLYVLDVTKDIVNHPCSVTINIYKEGSYLVSTESGYVEERKPLEGVVIGIYASEDIANYIGDVVIEKDTLIAVLVTDESGLATMTETLPAGSYYFKELKTLDNYVLDETKHEFSVSYENDNTTIEVNKENPLVNYPQSGTLNVHKVDQNGNALGAGVEFVVTCTNTGETWTLVTDADGNASLTGLAIGAYDENGTWTYYTYTLQETKTLDGYKLDDTVYTWQFTADNTNAEAVYQSFTVRNVILGIVDHSAAGGAGMLMLALVLVLMAIKKKKEEEEEELETVTETSEE